MGLSFNWWTNHRNSGMITWRYNEDLEMVELGVYTHRDGQWQAWFNPDKIDLDLPRREMEVFARVAIGAPVQCYINLIRAENKLAFTLKSPAYYQYIEIPFRARIPKRLRGINPYIGRGGRMALQDTYILRQTI